MTFCRMTPSVSCYHDVTGGTYDESGAEVSYKIVPFIPVINANDLVLQRT